MVGDILLQLPQIQPKLPMDGKDPPAPSEAAPVHAGQRFALERHLHEFLADNWAKTVLGQEWMIHSEPGEPEKGYKYPTLPLRQAREPDAPPLALTISRRHPFKFASRPDGTQDGCAGTKAQVYGDMPTGRTKRRDSSHRRVARAPGPT